MSKTSLAHDDPEKQKIGYGFDEDEGGASHDTPNDDLFFGSTYRQAPQFYVHLCCQKVAKHQKAGRLSSRALYRLGLQTNTITQNRLQITVPFFSPKFPIRSYSLSTQT